MPDEQSQHLGIWPLVSLCLSVKQHGQNKHLLNSQEYFGNTCHASLRQQRHRDISNLYRTVDILLLFCGRLKCFTPYSTTLFPGCWYWAVCQSLVFVTTPALSTTGTLPCNSLYCCTMTGLFSSQTFSRGFLLLMPSTWRIMRKRTSPSGNHS